MASTAVIRQSDVFIDGYAIAMSPPHLRQRGCMQCVHGRPGSHSSCANTDPLERRAGATVPTIPAPVGAVVYPERAYGPTVANG
jgi:hypothetical protein